MKNGLNLYSLIMMFLPMLRMVRTFIDDDDNGGGGDEAVNDFLTDLTGNEASPDSGKGDKKQTDVEKDGSGEKPEGKTQDPPDPAQAKDTVVTDDEIIKNLGFGETPEVKAQRLERDYKASSKEAIRLATREKSIMDKLEAQGIKLSISEDGKEVELFPTKGYKESGKADAVKIDVKKLDDEDVVSLESGDLTEIQKVVDKIIEKTKTALVRPLPTSDEPVQKLSDERVDLILSEMKDAVDLNGSKSFPGIDKNVPFIKHMLNDETIPKAMRDAFHKHPREMSRWMNAVVMLEKGKLAAAQKKAVATSQQKKDNGRLVSDLGVDSGGTVFSQEGSSERTVIDMMVNA